MQDALRIVFRCAKKGFHLTFYTKVSDNLIEAKSEQVF